MAAEDVEHTPEEIHIDELPTAVERTDRWRKLAGALAFGLPLLLCFLGGIGHRHYPNPGEYFRVMQSWWNVLLPVVLGAILAAFVAWQMLRRRQAAKPNPKGSLHVDAEQLKVGAGSADHAWSRSDIDHVYVSRKGVAPIVVGRMRTGHTVGLKVPSDSPDYVLEALRPDPQKQTSRIPIGSLAAGVPLLRVVAWPLFLGCMTGVGASLYGFASLAVEHQLHMMHPNLPIVFTAAVVLAGLLWRTLRQRSVVVGTDGVRVAGLFRWSFIPHGSIDNVVMRKDGGARLERPEGRAVELPKAPYVEGLTDTIAAVHEQSKQQVAPDPIGALECGERTVDEWVQALRSLDKDPTYREQPLRIEELQSIVRSPASPAEQRVAAAVALSTEAERSQCVRIAAEACADRDMQAALEAAAAGEIAEGKLRRLAHR